MSLHPQPFTAVPPETARVARAAFPKGNLPLRLRDELGAIDADAAFTPLFAERGQPAEAPWRLALVPILQYVEGLSDRQAADAVRSRIDWKYALNLELTDPGFDCTILCELRGRLLEGSAEPLLLDAFLHKCRERKWLKARGRQRTDSTQGLGAIRALNRVECVTETLRSALNSLAVVAPEWIRKHTQPEWVDRYARRAEEARLPTSKEERMGYADLVGRDGAAVLAALYHRKAPRWLREVPAVQLLRRVWVQQYYTTREGIRWRTEVDGVPPARLFISSPYDDEAPLGRKGTTQWVGYKVPLTESCAPSLPRLITHVETTDAPVGDSDVVVPIHDALKAKALLPRKHLVDTGYVEAKLLVQLPRDYGVDLVGPTRSDYHWQSQASHGFAAGDFQIDWQRQHATCPRGKTSLSWTPAIARSDNDVIKIKFSRRDCRPCPSRPRCTTSHHLRRTISGPRCLHRPAKSTKATSDTGL